MKTQNDKQIKYEQDEAKVLAELLKLKNLNDSEVFKKLEEEVNLFDLFVRFHEEFPYLALKEPELRKWTIKIIRGSLDYPIHKNSNPFARKINSSIVEENDYPVPTNFRDLGIIHERIEQIGELGDTRAIPILRNFVLDSSKWYIEQNEIINEFHIRLIALKTLKKLKYNKLLEVAVVVFENDPIYLLKNEAIRTIAELNGTIDMDKLWDFSRTIENDYFLASEMVQLALNSQELNSVKFLLYYDPYSSTYEQVKEKILSFDKKKLEELLMELLYSHEFQFKQEIYKFLLEIRGNEAVPILIKHLDESEHHFCTDEYPILLESLIKTSYDNVFPGLFKCFYPRLGDAIIGSWDWMDYDELYHEKIEEIADKKIVEAFESESKYMVEGVLNYVRNRPNRKWLKKIQEKAKDEEEIVRISAIYALESLSKEEREEVIEILISLVKKEPESYIVERAISVLREIQPFEHISELKKIIIPKMNELVRKGLLKLIEELEN